MMRWLLLACALVSAVAWSAPPAAPDEIPPVIKAELAFLKAFVARDPEADARSAIQKER